MATPGEGDQLSLVGKEEAFSSEAEPAVSTCVQAPGQNVQECRAHLLHVPWSWSPDSLEQTNGGSKPFLTLSVLYLVSDLLLGS